VAVLMLTFPDWVTGMLASGALAYVLLPHWSGQTPAQRHQTQQQMGRWLLLGAVLLGLLIVTFRQPLAQTLAGGLAPNLQTLAEQGLVWSAIALPAAFLAALGVARLQFENDFMGMYSANLVLNGVLIIALSWLTFDTQRSNATTVLGLALCAAMGLRMAWVLRRVPKPETGVLDSRMDSAPALPSASVWVWAALSAGLPLTLTLVARSIAAADGEGALSTFNYAWKLVELPLVLAIQLVATLTFPSISRALACGAGDNPTITGDARQAVRAAFILAWTLACAAVAALQVGAPALASLLFGWGRMPAERLADIAAWGAIGAWGLLPQAIVAVALMVLASQRRMHLAVIAYSGALFLLMIFGGWGPQGGMEVMWMLNGVLVCVALVLVGALLRGKRAAPWESSLLPLGALATPTLTLAAIEVTLRHAWRPTFPTGDLTPLWLCLGCGLGVLLISFAASREFRLAVQR
jgi:peptidoglycan biosynthesis protein MviN/MurJ (putative lipid II flippase)